MCNFSVGFLFIVEKKQQLLLLSLEWLVPHLSLGLTR